MSYRRSQRFRFELIRERRNALGLTNEELAREAQVTMRTLARWQGGHHKPQRAQVCMLALALGMQPEDFYEDADDPVAA